MLADASEPRVLCGELYIDLDTLLCRRAHLWGEGSGRHREHVHAGRSPSSVGGVHTLRCAPLLAPCWAPPDLREGEATASCCCCATSALLSAALGRGAAAPIAPCAWGVVVGVDPSPACVVEPTTTLTP